MVKEKSKDLDVVIDKPKNNPDEKTIQWETVRPFPDLARQLAYTKHDMAKVELGYEIRGTLRIEKFLLSLVRPIHNQIYFYTKTYTRKEFRGHDTAKQFKDEAFKFFDEIHRKGLN